MKIDPHSSLMVLTIISDGKEPPKTRKNSKIWRGWVKIGEKHKNLIFSETA